MSTILAIEFTVSSHNVSWVIKSFITPSAASSTGSWVIVFEIKKMATQFRLDFSDKKEQVKTKHFPTWNLTENRQKFEQAVNVIEETHFCLDLGIYAMWPFWSITHGI